MTYYIGIDPGTECGCAVLDEQGAVCVSGIWDLRPRRHEGGGMRYVRLRSYLRELLAAYPGALLAYEEVRRHLGTDAAHVYGGVVATLQQVCEEAGVPYRGVPVGTIKRLATGKGNADKGAMVAAAQVRWGANVQQHDEADALWCAEALRVEVGP